ncbi:MAG TPA: hypothetical protein VK206_04120 [Anaerolineales bacterium]|nr:hypothetical protein [Anaerolineales bacterium]HLO29688.1 hypothetical protein [Anaerolineales bacterium]
MRAPNPRQSTPGHTCTRTPLRSGDAAQWRAVPGSAGVMGLAAFLGSFHGLELVPSKLRNPAHQQVMPAVGWQTQKALEG